jgi:hypothetical protein
MEPVTEVREAKVPFAITDSPKVNLISAGKTSKTFSLLGSTETKSVWAYDGNAKNKEIIEQIVASFILFLRLRIGIFLP